MNLESYPTPRINPELETENPEISFLFVDHSSHNVAEITRRIAQSDADIILQELVGSSGGGTQ